MPTKDQEAVHLARMHYQVETGLSRVFRIRGSADVEVETDEPIKLLEVNENTVPMGIMPIRFGPSPTAGLSHSSIIVEITPDEFEKVEASQLELPHGWVVSELIERESE